MRKLRSIRYSTFFVLAALIPAVVTCGDSFEPPEGLVGTWNATAIVVDGVDYALEGMTLSFTFDADAEYSFTVTNDGFGFCDPDPNCSDFGDFTTTATQLTFDPGTIDEETFSYTVAGNTLTVSGTIDGSAFTFTFQKQ
jgi:hypothetical protein